MKKSIESDGRRMKRKRIRADVDPRVVATAASLKIENQSEDDFLILEQEQKNKIGNFFFHCFFLDTPTV